MLIITDPASPVPIYRQIADQIISQINEGAFAPGSRLPSAAALADSLGINRNTALEAYRTLRDEGVIELRRGRGALVRSAPSTSSTDEQDALIQRLVHFAQSEGLTLEDITRLLKDKGLS